jgi:hypothetical protein
MRRVLSTAEFNDKVERLVFTCPRGREALRGLIRVIRHSPDEQGMAVRGRSHYRGRPIHPQPDRSFLVVYTYDDESVTLVDVREVPSTAY